MNRASIDRLFSSLEKVLSLRYFVCPAQPVCVLIYQEILGGARPRDPLWSEDASTECGATPIGKAIYQPAPSVSTMEYSPLRIDIALSFDSSPIWFGDIRDSGGYNLP